MRTAEDLAGRLDPVADHPAVAMGAAWRHGVDGALEAVEGQCSPVLGNAERFVVVVTAHIALGHGGSSLAGQSFWDNGRIATLVPESAGRGARKIKTLHKAREALGD